jgi:hypothetical protein
MSVSGGRGARFWSTLISYEASCSFRPCLFVPVNVATGRASAAPRLARYSLTESVRTPFNAEPTQSLWLIRCRFGRGALLNCIGSRK